MRNFTRSAILTFGCVGPPPHEPFENVLRFRVAVLTIGYRGPPHPGPLPEERVPRWRPLFPSMVQRRNACACVGTSHPSPLPKEREHISTALEGSLNR